uniref:FAD dependent oxidoreductase central domain-containing protein n=1 Tax=Parascaris equorum TaxID=6256 RepID=A0A914R916_PAREQ
MVDGEPPTELFETDPNRFSRWSTHKFIADKSRETMSMFFNSANTQRPAGRPTERVSGIYSRLANQGGSFLFRNGWEVVFFEEIQIFLCKSCFVFFIASENLLTANELDHFPCRPSISFTCGTSKMLC